MEHFRSGLELTSSPGRSSDQCCRFDIAAPWHTNLFRRPDCCSWAVVLVRQEGYVWAHIPEAHLDVPRSSLSLAFSKPPAHSLLVCAFRSCIIFFTCLSWRTRRWMKHATGWNCFTPLNDHLTIQLESGAARARPLRWFHLLQQVKVIIDAIYCNKWQR